MEDKILGSSETLRNRPKFIHFIGWPEGVPGGHATAYLRRRAHINLVNKWSSLLLIARMCIKFLDRTDFLSLYIGRRHGIGCKKAGGMGRNP
jgi:hypothetical protein